ncbi:MAG: hypothetical protein IH605_01030 [Burkholderiales bacterium]|nr:hypothetical protein [Burkholderiales bacterium]
MKTQEQILELEQNLVRGDIASALRTIAQIYDCPDALDSATQKVLKALETIYHLSFPNSFIKSMF